ncbi:MAG: 1-phosphofructokinase family hexose kinase [Novosphingobium sp.]|nr:1-phosphofructokinase family hexose kinase [Novosphingobium sp.]
MNPAIDLSYEVDAIEPTRKLRARRECLFPGGGGINVARVLARLGRSVSCVYLAGGTTGPTFEALVAEHGLHAVPVPIAGTTRIATTVHEARSGLEYRFTPPGPNVSEAEWRACIDRLEEMEADWLIASGSLPEGVPTDFYAHLAAQAARKGTRLVLDSSGEALRAGVAGGGVYMAKPNQDEFEKLTGRTFATPQAIGEAAREVVRTSGMIAIVVTLGNEGAVLATADHFEFCPALALETKSAVGAGDSFVAGMVHALAGGEDMADAFRLGMASGSAAILTAGTSLALREDIERLYAEYRKA